MALRRSMRALVACAVVSMLADTPAAFSQPVSRFASVKTWNGSFSFKYSANIPSDNGFDKIEMQFDGTFTVNQNDEFPTWYDGPIEMSRSHVSYSAVRKFNCTQTSSMKSDGPVIRWDQEILEPDVRVYVYAQGWRVHFRKNMLKAALVEAGCGLDRTIDGFAAFPSDTPQFPVPAAGEGLEQKFPVPGVVVATSFGAPFQYGPWEGEIHLSPTRDEFVLDVTSSDYKTWRPMVGNTITFTAALKRASGVPAGVGVKQMEWTLVDTSNEPGESSNYPMGVNLPAAFDMRFAPRAGQLPGDSLNQAVLSGWVSDATDTATVESSDWGGWSTLRVVATLDNGAQVVGKLKETGEEEILLPKRRKDSFIADAWRDATGAQGPDNEDDEKSLGKVFGDGLTLYEEYRGFMVKGVHVSGDPKRQDLFVRNQVGQRVEGGITLFERLTGIVVHRLEADEFNNATRLVNSNSGKGPKVTDQHGILIQFRPGSVTTTSADYFVTRSMSSDLPNFPGDVRYIEVPHGPVIGPAAFGRDGTTPYEDVAFAHEMMHAVGVRHHGQGDYQATWDADSSGTLVGEKGPAGTTWIKLIKSDGKTDVTANIASDIKVSGQFKTEHIGVMRGESSGDDNCIMRYDINSAFISPDPSRKDWRMLINSSVNPETVGVGICTSAVGTGINAGTSSRYGDATIGNCAAQIHVRDLP